MSGLLGVTEEVQNSSSLIAADNFGPVRLSAVITVGNYSAGQILGRITASGKLTAYAAGNADGSEVAVAVLLENTDASSSDVNGVVGFAGVYLEANTTGLDDAAKLAFEAKAIYFV